MARTITIEPALMAWLAGRPQVTAVAGDPARIWPWSSAPQGRGYPHLLVARVGGNRLRSTRGPTTRVSHPRIQLDAVGRTAADAYQLAEAVALVVEDELQGGYLDGHRVQSARCTLPAYRAGNVTETAAGSNPVFGDEAAEPRLTMMLDLWFEEG